MTGEDVKMEDDESLKYVGDLFVFLAGGARFAVPVTHVVEIIQVENFEANDGIMHSCIGTMVHGDRLVPVFDSAVIGLGQKTEKTSKTPNTIVTLRYEYAVFGLTMDQHIDVIGGIERCLDNQAEANGYTRPHGKRFIESIVGYDGATLIVLSVEEIVKEVELALGNQDVIGLAERIEEEVAQDSDLDAVDYLTARIGEVEFAVPITKVVEVIEGYDVTPLYNVDKFIRGLINLRGQVIVCIDISMELDLDLRILDERNRFILLQDQDGELALCIDEVIGIQNIPEEQFRQSSLVLSGKVTGLFSGILENQSGTLLLLAVEALTNSERLLPYRQGDVAN